jgi:hypothetical protein
MSAVFAQNFNIQKVPYASVASCSKVVEGSPDARFAKGDQSHDDNLEQA